MPHFFQERAGRDNPHLPIFLKVQQVMIACDNPRRPGAMRAGDHMFIIRVTTHRPHVRQRLFPHLPDLFQRVTPSLHVCIGIPIGFFQARIVK